MNQLDKISISQFIWYLVPGLGLIYFILFPLLVFNPKIIKLFFSTVGPFGLIILGIIFGFLLDGLRLYRFRPKYFKIRKNFFLDLQSIIAVNLNPYFIQSHITDLANCKKTTGLSLHHAIWIMLGNFTILAFLEAIYWALYCLYLIFFPPCSYLVFGRNISRNNAIVICAMFSVIFFVVAFRFLRISIEDQNNTNKMFTNFAKQYRDEIRKLLNITPRD